MILGGLAVAWLLGLAAAAFTGSDPWAAVAAASALGAFSFALRPRPSTLAFSALAAALVFTAFWRYETTEPPDAPSGIAFLNGGPEVLFRALVVAEPEAPGSSVRYRLAVREVYASGRCRRRGPRRCLGASQAPRRWPR